MRRPSRRIHARPLPTTLTSGEGNPATSTMLESVTTTSWITTLSTAIVAPASDSIGAPSSCRIHAPFDQVQPTTLEGENATEADVRRLLGTGTSSSYRK